MLARDVNRPVTVASVAAAAVAVVPLPSVSVTVTLEASASTPDSVRLTFPDSASLITESTETARLCRPQRPRWYPSTVKACRSARGVTGVVCHVDSYRYISVYECPARDVNRPVTVVASGSRGCRRSAITVCQCDRDRASASTPDSVRVTFPDSASLITASTETARSVPSSSPRWYPSVKACRSARGVTGVVCHVDSYRYISVYECPARDVNRPVTVVASTS